MGQVGLGEQRRVKPQPIYEAGRLTGVISVEHGFLCLRLPNRRRADSGAYEWRWLIVCVGPRGGQKPFLRGPWGDSPTLASQAGQAKLRELFPDA